MYSVVLFFSSYKVNMDDWQLSRSTNIVVIVIIVLILAAIIVLLVVAFNSWNNDNSGSDDGGGGTPAENGAISGGDLFPEGDTQKPAPVQAPANVTNSVPKSKDKAPPPKSAHKGPDSSDGFEDFSLRDFSLPAKTIQFVNPDDFAPPDSDKDFVAGNFSADLSARVELILEREPDRDMSLSSAKTPSFSSAQTPVSSRHKHTKSEIPSGLESGHNHDHTPVVDPSTATVSSPSTQVLEADSSKPSASESHKPKTPESQSVAPKSRKPKTSLTVGDVLARSSSSHVEEETSGQSVDISVPCSEHPNVPSDFSSFTERPPTQKRPKDPVAKLAKIFKD